MPDDDVFDRPAAWRAEAVARLGLNGEARLAGLTIGAGYPDALEPVRRAATDTSGRWCDVGSGLGAAAVWITAGDALRAVAVEPEPRAAALGRRLFPALPVVSGGADALPLRDGSCGGVSMLGLVTLLADLDAALDEAARVLQEGGVLAISDLASATAATVAVGATGNRFRPVDDLLATLTAHGFATSDVQTAPADAPAGWDAISDEVAAEVERAHGGTAAFEAWAQDGAVLRSLTGDGTLERFTVTARRSPRRNGRRPPPRP